MQLKEAIKRVDIYFNYKNNHTPSVKNIKILSEISEIMRYDEALLKHTLASIKKSEKKIKTAQKLIKEFPEYFNFLLAVIEAKNKCLPLPVEKDGTLFFMKETGTFVFLISKPTLNTIKKLLIKKGYTDEKNFNATLLKQRGLSLINLFLKEIKEEAVRKIDTLNKTLSKKEAKKINKILKEKK